MTVLQSLRPFVLVGLVMIHAASCSEESKAGPSFSFLLPPQGESISLDNIPFPNDLLLDDVGQLHLSSAALPFGADANADVLSLVAAAFEEDSCYGGTTGVIFPLTGLAQGDAVDSESLTGHVRWIDLQSGIDLPVEIHVRTRQQQVYVRPRIGTSLAEGRSYAVLVEDGVRLLSGQKIEMPADFRAVMREEESTDERLQQARRAYGPLRELLSADAESKPPLTATVLSTCDFATDMAALGEALDAQAAPTLAIDKIWRAGSELDQLLGTPASGEPGYGLPDGMSHDSIAYLVRGSFQSPNFQAPTPGALGRWQRDDEGAPMQQGEDRVPVTLVIPTNLASYLNMPVVIFQHGLNASSADVLAVADTLAARGIATIGIDIPFHGARFPGAVDKRHNFIDLEEPDGITDSTGTTPVLYLFDLLGDENAAALDPRVQTAGFVQAALDVLRLVDLIDGGDLSALSTLEPALAGLSFRADRLVYSSESFGGLIGTVALAFEPRLKAAFLAVAGGGIIADLVENSPEVGSLFVPVLAGTFDVAINQLDPRVDPAHTHRAFQLMGSLMARSDPLAYAQRLRQRGIHLVLAAAYSDEIVANQSSETLAAALGLPWLNVPGVVADGPRYLAPGELQVQDVPATNNLQQDGVAHTAGFFELELASHGMLTRRDGHRNYKIGFPPPEPLDPSEAFENPTTFLQELLADFAESYLLSGTPTIGRP